MTRCERAPGCTILTANQGPYKSRQSVFFQVNCDAWCSRANDGLVTSIRAVFKQIELRTKSICFRRSSRGDSRPSSVIDPLGRHIVMLDNLRLDALSNEWWNVRSRSDQDTFMSSVLSLSDSEMVKYFRAVLFAMWRPWHLSRRTECSRLATGIAATDS